MTMRTWTVLNNHVYNAQLKTTAPQRAFGNGVSTSALVVHCVEEINLRGRKSADLVIDLVSRGLHRNPALLQDCSRSTVRAYPYYKSIVLTSSPYAYQKWSMEVINSTCPHCQREICKQSDPTATETDSIPYGKYTMMFAGLIIGNSYYSITKKRVLKKMKGSLVVCLS